MPKRPEQIDPESAYAGLERAAAGIRAKRAIDEKGKTPRQLGIDLYFEGRERRVAQLAGLGRTHEQADAIVKGWDAAQLLYLGGATPEGIPANREGALHRGMQAYADGKDLVEILTAIADPVERELITAGWNEANRNEQSRRMGVGGYGD